MFSSGKKRAAATAGASLALVAALVGVGLTTPSAPVQAATTGLEQLRQAAPSGTPAAKPGRPEKPNRGQDGQDQQGRAQQAQAQQQAYLNALAGRLGVTTDQLTEAMKQARIDLVNQAVAEGRIDQERANRMIQAIQSGQRPGNPGAGPRPGQSGQPGQRGPAGQADMRAAGPRLAADVLGLTPEQLRAELQSGKSLAQIGEARGISRDTLKARLLDAHKARLDAAVANGRLTAEQAQQVADRMAANIDRMLDATPGQRRGPRAQGSGG